MTGKKKFYLLITFCVVFLILLIILIILFAPQDTSRDEIYQRMEDKAKIANVIRTISQSPQEVLSEKIINKHQVVV